ncbi:hypothetical protein [Micromonospora sp. MH99]|uniref:hypothetical protein n=1 Tax=Micromonospora sp. MH99 TaxID=1945510 RepID=UPI001F3C8114|nr:hypothetical protein [Micromonospora sp. MH99]MCF0092836.1 hypothetical protein [Micromonospora sp. MH99]
MTGRQASISATVYQPTKGDQLALHVAKLFVGLATSSLSRSLQDALDRRSAAKRLAAEDGYLVPIPGDGAIEPLRRSWAKAAEYWRSEPRALLDLTECSFSDVAGPVYLISKIVERHRLGLVTRVRLPEQPEMIDFLREINFLDAVTVASETSLSQLLTTESLYRLTRVDSYLKRAPGNSRRPTLPFNIFPLKVLQLGSNTRHAPAVRYAADWLSKHVVAALDRDLAGPGAQVARLVILETLIRASIGHDKQTAVVAAHYGLHRGDRAYLQIAFWWDGAGERSTRVATTDLLELVFDEPENVLAALPHTPMAVRDAWQLPSSPTVLASAVVDIFGGQLDTYGADAHLALARDQRDGTDVPAPTPTLTYDRSNGGAVLGDLVVVTLPLND